MKSESLEAEAWERGWHARIQRAGDMRRFITCSHGFMDRRCTKICLLYPRRSCTETMMKTGTEVVDLPAEFKDELWGKVAGDKGIKITTVL